MFRISNECFHTNSLSVAPFHWNGRTICHNYLINATPLLVICIHNSSHLHDENFRTMNLGIRFRALLFVVRLILVVQCREFDWTVTKLKINSIDLCTMFGTWYARITSPTLRDLNYAIVCLHACQLIAGTISFV